MKRLIDRAKGRPQPLPPPSDDVASTLPEDAEPVAWDVRAHDVGAVPLARDTGAALLARAWGRDRHVATLGADALASLGERLRFVQVAAGRDVIRQDEHADYMLVLLDGAVGVDRVQPWGGRTRLVEARPGDTLGEMSLLDAGTRFSACTTLCACSFAVIDRAELDAWIKDEPRLALAVLSCLSRRLSLRLRQVGARLSALLSRD